MPGYIEAKPSDRETMRPASPLIEVKDVSKRFGTLQALQPTGFDVGSGIIFGLVGSDGAGKTTLLRMMATMLKPTTGQILIRGFDVSADKARVKNLIGYMPQRFGLYQDLTVGENFDFFMDIYGIPAAERSSRRETYLGFSNLLPFVEREAGNLSGGMKQKLGLACVLVHEPDVLILDEPTNGVDPVSRQEFWEMLMERRDQGMTIVVSTAYLDEGEKCDRILLMHRSRALAEASPAELRGDFPDLESAVIQRIEDVEGAI